MNKGIRKGCPISALLYLFVAEIPSLKLKLNNEINGINISNMQKDIKNIQHTDDIKLALKDINTLNIAIQLLKISVNTQARKSTLAKHNVFIRMY